MCVYMRECQSLCLSNEFPNHEYKIINVNELELQDTILNVKVDHIFFLKWMIQLILF